MRLCVYVLPHAITAAFTRFCLLLMNERRALVGIANEMLLLEARLRQSTTLKPMLSSTYVIMFLGLQILAEAKKNRNCKLQGRTLQFLYVVNLVVLD